MGKNVSLSTIAEAVGLSKMTVSLALRGHPRIPRATQERIVRVAEELGYRPNPEVAQFMSAIRRSTADERGFPIAYITWGSKRGEWRKSPTENAYWDGAAVRAESYGYHLEEHWIEQPHMTPRRLSDILWNRGIKGVVVPPMIRTLTGDARERTLELDWSRFVAVTISDMLTSPQLHRVTHDHYASMLVAMDRLLERGYRRIGLCLTEHMDLTVNQRWQAGYRVYRANHPLERIEPLILPDLSADAIEEWINQNQLDAIVSAERRMPRFLTEIGLELWKDIGYADLDLYPQDPAFTPISGIIQNSKIMGAAAIDLVTSGLQRNQMGVPDVPFVLQVEGEWRDRQSTPGFAAS
jgi:LacI family transcriptional regulator